MVLEGLVNVYNGIVESGDSRSAELPFIKSPVYVFGAAFFYLIMVTAGPKFMENRKALQLRGVLVGYNLFSVVLSLWMMYELFVTSFLNPKFNLLCEDIDESDRSPMTMRLIRVHWVYFFSKVIEFFDTFFFVVRKKNNQISFLHCYHHVSMLIMQWAMVKLGPGGPCYFGTFLNCFIHSLMYTYYMLAAFGPHMQKYLWWKRYLTKMQLYQFVLIFLYCSNGMTYKSEKQKAKTVMNAFFWVHWFYMISLFWLFTHFYQNAYNKKKEDYSKAEQKLKES